MIERALVSLIGLDVQRSICTLVCIHYALKKAPVLVANIETQGPDQAISYNRPTYDTGYLVLLTTRVIKYGIL